MQISRQKGSLISCIALRTVVFQFNQQCFSCSSLDQGCSTPDLQVRSGLWSQVIMLLGLPMDPELWWLGSGGSVNWCSPAAKFQTYGESCRLCTQYHPNTWPDPNVGLGQCMARYGRPGSDWSMHWTHRLTAYTDPAWDLACELTLHLLSST